MTDPQVMAALEPTRADIAPCHFCDTPLSFSSGKHNKVGRCDTEGCWMHDRKMTVPVDDAVQIAQWNRARHRIASSFPAEPVALPGWFYYAMKAAKESGQDLILEAKDMDALLAAPVPPPAGDAGTTANYSVVAGDAEVRKALECVDGDWQWLCDQLEQYPVRVHPDRTTSDSYLRESAAKIIRALLATPPSQDQKREEG